MKEEFEIELYNKKIIVKRDKDGKFIIPKIFKNNHTGLKPAVELIVMAQKPYENTYAENTLKYGCGGLNIDMCRIQYQPSHETDNRIGTDATWKGKRDASQHTVSLPAIEGMQMYKNKGRWPSNLLLQHHPLCKLVGSKQVKTSTLLKKHNVKNPKYNYLSNTYNVQKLDKRIISQDYGKNGYDITEAWECHPDCPIRLLDEQSGDCPTGSITPYTSKIISPDVSFWNKEFFHENYHKSSKGGASRFFYSSKAHKSERNAGLDDLDNISNTEMVNRKEGSAGIENARAGAGRGKGAKNNISTLKPINVMRYLVRLVTPPNGIVLDPFAGSGTTGIACLIESFQFILIEKRKRFANLIIPKRLEYWKEPKNWSLLKDHNALPKIKTLKDKKTNRSMEEFLN